MTSRALCGFICVVMAIAGLPVDSAGQVSGRVLEKGASGTAHLSPTVGATWHALDTGGGAELTFAILWRGAPEWYRQSDTRLSVRTGGTTSYSARGQVIGGEILLTVLIGKNSYNVRYDRVAKTVDFRGQEIAVQDKNIVLVDIGRARGSPTIVGNARVDPSLPSLSFDAPAILRRSEEVLEFLR